MGDFTGGWCGLTAPPSFYPYPQVHLSVQNQNSRGLSEIWDEILHLSLPISVRLEGGGLTGGQTWLNRRVHGPHYFLLCP
jgi:hypothetical protein